MGINLSLVLECLALTYFVFYLFNRILQNLFGGIGPPGILFIFLFVCLFHRVNTTFNSQCECLELSIFQVAQVMMVQDLLET